MDFEFDINMTVAALFDYNVLYTYTSPSGIIGTAAGALFLIVYALNGALLYLGAALLLLLYTPVTLYTRSYKQVKLNPMYKHPIHYRMNDEGVTVSQNDEELTLEWKDCYKARSTARSIVLYTNKKLGWIFPNSQLGEKRTRLIEIISTHMPPDKVNIKQ